MPKSKSRRKSDPQEQPGPSRSRRSSVNAVSNAAIMKRISELRPVLPRPPSDPLTSSGPVHIPSSGGHHTHPQRHHRSGQAPYELAYGMTHQHPLHHQSYVASPPHSNPIFSPADQTFAEPIQLIGMHPQQWNSSTDNVGFDNPNPSMCGCGDDCNCPGCLHHNRVTNIPPSSAYASCTNPGACGACLDCAIMSLPTSALLPTDDTALSIPSARYEPVAEWLRQVSSDFTESSSFQQNFFQQWNQSPNFPQNPVLMSPNFNYGSSSPVSVTSLVNGKTFSHDHRRSASNIDPRLLPRVGTMPGSDPNFIGDPLRSRSPSTSSQSSEGHNGGHAVGYRLDIRQHGMYINPRSGSHMNVGRGVSSSSSSVSSLPLFGS